MIAELFEGFFELIKKPALLLPALLVAAVMLIVLFFSDAAIEGFLTDVVLNDAVPQTSTINLPFLLFSMYPAELATIIVSAFVFGIASNWLAFCFARFVKKRKGLGEAFGFANKNLGNAFFLALFDFLAIGFLFAVALAISGIGELNGWAGLVLGIVFVLLAIVAYLILLFLPTALAVGELTIKQALGESAGFVKKRIVFAFVFVLIVGLLSTLISNIGTGINNSLESADEIVSLLVDLAFLLVAIAYAGLAVPIYYVSAQKAVH